MEALAIIGVIVGLVWLGAYIRFAGLLGGSVIVVVVGVVFGYFYFHTDIGPVSVTLDRAALGGLVVLYAAFRILGQAEPKRLTIDDGVLAAFVGYLLFNLLTHPASADDVNPLSLWVFYFFTPLVLYWIVRQSPMSSKGVAAAFAMLIGLGVYLAVMAFFEKQGWHGLVFPRFIVSGEHEEFFGRGRGPLLNPIGNGLYLTTAFVAGLLWWPDLKLRGRLCMAPLLSVIGVGILCTMTRSVWLGAALAAVIPFTVRLNRTQQVGAAILGLVMVVGLLAAKGANMAEFKRDKEVSAHDMAQSVKLRPLLALIAWEIFKDEPVFGCGLQRYREVSVDYINRRFTDMPIEQARGYVQHNVFLAVLVETGLVGLTLFLSLLALWCRRGWALANTGDAWSQRVGMLLLAFVAAYVVNGMFHDLNVIMMVNQLVFLLAALTLGLSLQACGSQRRAAPAFWRASNQGVASHG